MPLLGAQAELDPLVLLDLLLSREGGEARRDWRGPGQLPVASTHSRLYPPPTDINPCLSRPGPP